MFPLFCHAVQSDRQIAGRDFARSLLFATTITTTTAAITSVYLMRNAKDMGTAEDWRRWHRLLPRHFDDTVAATVSLLASRFWRQSEKWLLYVEIRTSGMASKRCWSSLSKWRKPVWIWLWLMLKNNRRGLSTSLSFLHWFIHSLFVLNLLSQFFVTLVAI